MGKKGRNVDGSKKKKVPIVEEDGEVFEDDFIWELKRSPWTASDGLEWCIYCEKQVPININKLREHYSCPRHKNYENFYDSLAFFGQHGMRWMDDERTFYCGIHGVVLEAKYKSLLEHVQNHPKIEQAITGGGEEDFGGVCSTVPLFKYRYWKVDLKSTNAGLTRQFLSYKRVECPLTMRDDSPSNSFLGNLRNDIFTKGDLSLMTKVASFLEIAGDKVDRSEIIQGSQMKAFGMRWAHGDTGWYKHKNSKVYKVAEELATFVSERLELKYPNVFKHLHKVREVEGFGLDSASIGNTVFSTFCITRDYNCRPHNDKDDYDLGFILWLQEDHIEIEEEVSLFVLPELKVAFAPRHGDVLCFRARTLDHCTRSLKKKNQLGLAFFQKASLFRHLKTLLDLDLDGVIEHHIPKRGKTPAKTIVERRSDFEEKRTTYEKEFAAGTISINDF